ncbi:MAG: methyltransferase domain-containing protein [bacterium]
MERREYERLREHEAGYWWHVARRDMIHALLEEHVPRDPARKALDIGCGTGANFDLLAPWGTFFGTEVEPGLWGGGARPDRPVLLARGERLPFADGTFGLCTFFDVLEHVEAEREFLKEVRRVLVPGGLVLLSVPAYMFLWSRHDESLRHFRRYVRRTLSEALFAAHLEVLRMTHGMASILPPVAAVRWMARLTKSEEGPQSSYVDTPEPVGRVLTGVLGAEARWLRHGDLPFGTSIFALARRSGA